MKKDLLVKAKQAKTPEELIFFRGFCNFYIYF